VTFVADVVVVAIAVVHGVVVVAVIEDGVRVVVIVFTCSWRLRASGLWVCLKSHMSDVGPLLPEWPPPPPPPLSFSLSRPPPLHFSLLPCLFFVFCVFVTHILRATQVDMIAVAVVVVVVVAEACSESVQTSPQLYTISQRMQLAPHSCSLQRICVCEVRTARSPPSPSLNTRWAPSWRFGT
jgi:hypothetical protein